MVQKVQFMIRHPLVNRILPVYAIGLILTQDCFGCDDNALLEGLDFTKNTTGLLLSYKGVREITRAGISSIPDAELRVTM